MKKLCIICLAILLCACSKKNQDPIEDCVIQKDQLLNQVQQLQAELNKVKQNISVEINQQTQAKKQELDARIESYNTYQKQLIDENQAYKTRLRFVILCAFAGVLLSMIIINIILFKRYTKNSTGKKLYEE